MTDPAARGYAHPEVLVSTDWVAEHLDDPDVRIVESNEDPLLYPSGHIPGAVKIDWTRDLNDPLRRDYIDRDGFERADAAQRHRHATPRSSSTATRTTGGPATPSGSSSSSATRKRAGHGRRPAEVGAGGAAADARGAGLSRREPTSRPSATTRASAPSATRCWRTSQPAGRWWTCAAPRSSPASGCTCRSTRTRARCAAATSRARRACRGRGPSIPRRHVQDRRRAARDLLEEQRPAARRGRSSPTAGSASAAATPGSCSPTCSGYPRGAQLRRQLDRVGQPGGRADRALSRAAAGACRCRSSRDWSRRSRASTAAGRIEALIAFAEGFREVPREHRRAAVPGAQPGAGLRVAGLRLRRAAARRQRSTSTSRSRTRRASRPRRWRRSSARTLSGRAARSGDARAVGGGRAALRPRALDGQVAGALRHAARACSAKRGSGWRSRSRQRRRHDGRS